MHGWDLVSDVVVVDMAEVLTFQSDFSSLISRQFC